MFECSMQLNVVIFTLLTASVCHYVYKRFFKFILLAYILKLIHLNVAKIKKSIFEEALAKILSISERTEVLGIFVILK